MMKRFDNSSNVRNVHQKIIKIRTRSILFQYRYQKYSQNNLKKRALSILFIKGIKNVHQKTKKNKDTHNTSSLKISEIFTK